MAKSGLIFEKFVKNILLNVGFYDVKPDNFLIFNGSPGKMIHGLGQPHNADVLMEPPFQTPFYYPTRLIIECKDYNKAVGLDVVRSAVGLRDDINHFEIIDIKTLQQRRNMKRRTKALFAFDRYLYQVAIASSSRFTMPAQEFAHAHRINLITFDNFPLFNQVRDVIHTYSQRIEIEMKESSEETDIDLDDNITKRWKFEVDQIWRNIMNEDIKNLETNDYNIYNYINDISLAVTAQGLVIFLYKVSDEYRSNLSNDEYEMYFDKQDTKQWTLVTNKNTYKFVLPQYYTDIIENNINTKTRYTQLDIKTNYFWSLVLFTKSEKPHVISLSNQFIQKVLSQERRSK